MQDGPSGDKPSLFVSYREQDAKYGQHIFRRWRLALACGLLFLGAAFGWAVLPIPVLLSVCFADFWPYSSFVVMVLAFLAAYREEAGIAAVGAILGLLFQFPSVGTIFCAAALAALWKVESSGPPLSARRRRKNP